MPLSARIPQKCEHSEQAQTVVSNACGCQSCSQNRKRFQQKMDQGLRFTRAEISYS